MLFLLYITSQASTHPLRFSPATGTAMFSKRSTIAFMKHYLYITLLKVTFIESKEKSLPRNFCVFDRDRHTSNFKYKKHCQRENFVFTGEGVKMTAFEGNLLIKTSHNSYSTKFNSNLIE